MMVIIIRKKKKRTLLIKLENSRSTRVYALAKIHDEWKKKRAIIARNTNDDTIGGMIG